MDQEFCFDHVKLEINIIHPNEAINQGVFISVEKSGIALKMWIHVDVWQNQYNIVKQLTSN